MLQIWITGSRAQNPIFIHETDIFLQGAEIQQCSSKVSCSQTASKLYSKVSKWIHKVSWMGRDPTGSNKTAGSHPKLLLTLHQGFASKQCQCNVWNIWIMLPTAFFSVNVWVKNRSNLPMICLKNDFFKFRLFCHLYLLKIRFFKNYSKGGGLTLFFSF